MRELQGDVRGKLQSEYGARRDGGQRAEWQNVAGAIIHADKRFFTSRCSSSRIVFTMPVASLLEHYALISRPTRNAGRGEFGEADNQQDGISPGRFIEIIPLFAQGAYTLPSCQEALL